jgi:hypothetical protein
MAERPDQIERHIESARTELGSNLQELEYKVKQATDWRTHFERSPMTLIGVAFGGGVLLASMLGPKKWDVPAEAREYERSKSSSDYARRKPMSDTWDTLKSAVIGFTALKVRKVLDEALPGFGEQFEKAEREASNRGVSRPHTYDRELEASTHRM